MLGARFRRSTGITLCPLVAHPMLDRVACLKNRRNGNASAAHHRGGMPRPFRQMLRAEPLQSKVSPTGWHRQNIFIESCIPKSLSAICMTDNKIALATLSTRDIPLHLLVADIVRIIFLPNKAYVEFILVLLKPDREYLIIHNLKDLAQNGNHPSRPQTRRVRAHRFLRPHSRRRTSRPDKNASLLLHPSQNL